MVAVVSDTLGTPDTTHLEPCLQALSSQAAGQDAEIIVPHTSDLLNAASLRSRYPKVRFVECADVAKSSTGSREHHDELRARGILASRGEVVALLEDHGIPAPGWVQAIEEAHREPVAAVGGPIDNGIPKALNEAICLCDFAKYQSPVPDGESAFASDANVSYKRSSLDAIREVWKERFQETAVNWALRSRGDRIVLSQKMALQQYRQNLDLSTAMRERYIWGRSYARARASAAPLAMRLLWTVFSPMLPFLLLTRIAALSRRRSRAVQMIRSTPLLIPLLASWSSGEFAGYMSK